MISLEYMKRALVLAESALGNTGTNPLVGAVVVKDGQIVAEGLHRSFGADHAEVDALNRAGSLAAEADLYVTLEPCTHYGKTPPCVEAIKAAGIRRVIAATLDPNPIVNGAGIRALDHSGIEVVTGVCEDEARRLNEVYFKHVTTGLPFVTAKIAQTLDGFIADTSFASKWITSVEARDRVHKLRTTVDAVLVGAGTIRADDPVLSSHGIGKNPIRLILSRSGQIPGHLRVLNPESGGRTIVVQSGPDPHNSKHNHWFIDDDLRTLLRRAASEGISHILLEGGKSIFSQFIDAGFVDKFIFVIAPKLLGAGVSAFQSSLQRSIEDSLQLSLDRVERVSGDLWIEAYPR